jgi:ParB-like chromosome segregation protein Spo0J
MAVSQESPISAQVSLRVLPLAELRPAPYNPRRQLQVTDPAYRKLAASLREFGLVEPLVWNEETGHLVGGHARLEILREMGVREVTVSVVHLSPAREKALNVVLNNLEAQGRFDTVCLADLLDELQDLPELKLTGFEPSDLAGLRLEPVRDFRTDEDNPEQVEVTLLTDPTTYDRLAPQLDVLVREFDLTSHVRRR